MIKLPERLRNALGTQGEPPAHKINSPVFVTGCMRSGTTFLVDKLTTHPQMLKIGVELNRVWTEIGGASIKGRCEHKTAEDASPEYTFQMTHYITEFIAESRSLKRKTMRRYLKRFHGLGRANYDWDHIVPVNKSPHLMNKLGYVGALFPSSTLILIVRDIYSHSASMKVHFDKLYAKKGVKYFMEPEPEACYSQTFDDQATGPAYPGDFSIIPKMWIRMNYLAMCEMEGATFEKKIVLSYEDMVLDQGDQLQQLFDELDLRRVHEPEAERIANEDTVLVNTTTQGDPLQKWKKQLSAEEIQIIDRVVAEESEKYKAILNWLEEEKLKTH